MEKIIRTWSLMKMSWRILIRDKRILIFPFMSGLSCLAIAATFFVPLVVTGHWQPPVSGAPPMQVFAYYANMFLFYYCNYFVIVFFNSALVTFAMMRMNGGEPTLGEGLRGAFQRWPLIAGWAFIAATVGFVLKIIEDRSDKIGQIVAGLLGGAWALVTFLVVPILVVERKNPFNALKESTMLLKRTWGENIMMRVSFSTISFLLAIPAFGLIALGALAHNPIVLAACIAAAVLYFILLALVQSALEAIFQTAIYFFACSRRVPAGFELNVLESAITAR